MSAFFIRKENYSLKNYNHAFLGRGPIIEFNVDGLYFITPILVLKIGMGATPPCSLFPFCQKKTKKEKKRRNRVSA